jgi:hypothetical protein
MADVMDRADQGVLRWGGLAGVLGSLLFILVFAIVGVFVGADAVEPAGAIMRFPDIRSARTVENGLYLIVLILWCTHVIALGRALVGTRRAPALFGGALGIVGLTVLAAGALPHAVTVPLSDLYHAPGATAADQATLVLVWQGMQATFDALLVTGLAILPVSVLVFGVAMLEAPGFGRRIGSVSVGIGVIATIAAIILLIDPLSFIAVVGILVLIVFHLVAGSRLYRLSRA